MMLNSLLSIVKLSEATGDLVAWNILTGHLWVMLITGIIFCLIPLMGEKKNNIDQKLARMAHVLKHLIEEEEE